MHQKTLEERKQMDQLELLDYYREALQQSSETLMRPNAMADDVKDSLHDLFVLTADMTNDPRLKHLHSFSKYIHNLIENTYTYDVCRATVVLSVNFLIETMSVTYADEMAHLQQCIGIN